MYTDCYQSVMDIDISDKDNSEFSHLYVAYRLRFVRFAASYIRYWGTAEDIVTEALMHYWENRNTLPPYSNVPAYILTIVRNRCLNHLRHNAIKETYSKEAKEYYEWDLNTRISTLEACDPSYIYSEEVQELVAKAFAKMPQTTREIFTQSRIDGLTFKEIAAQRGCSVKTVEYHMSKALKVLRNELKDYFPFFYFSFRVKPS